MPGAVERTQRPNQSMRQGLLLARSAAGWSLSASAAGCSTALKMRLPRRWDWSTRLWRTANLVKA